MIADGGFQYIRYDFGKNPLVMTIQGGEGSKEHVESITFPILILSTIVCNLSILLLTGFSITPILSMTMALLHDLMLVCNNQIK